MNYLQMTRGLLLLCFMLYAPPKLFAQVKTPGASNNAIEITGTLKDLNGETLVGTSIRVKGTNTGVSSDGSGVYRIGVSNTKAVLVFSMIGYKTREVIVGDRKKIDIVLTEEPGALNEVVVVGYGTAKRRDVTGAIVSISSEDISKRMVTSVAEALQGQAAGVQVSTGSGQPGESASIVIRGMSTMNSDGIGPLFVIDGVQQTDADAVNPNDIESIEILKDAASASIYGSRSANGVIIITTKKGSKRLPVVEAKYLHSINNLSNKLPQLNAAQYRTLQKKQMAYINGEGALLVPTAIKQALTAQITDSLNFILNADNDYQAILFGTSQKNQVDVSLGGASDNLKYFLASGYLNEQGIIDNTSFDRFTTRLNADYAPSKKLNLGTRFNLSYAKKKGTDEADFLNSLLSRKPNLSFYYPDETLIGVLWGTNPIALSAQTNFTDTYNGTFYQLAEFKITPNLKLTSSLNANLSLSRYKFQRPSFLYSGGLTNSGISIANLNWNWMNENYLNYTKTVNNVHNFTALLGVSAQGWRLESDRYSGRNSATDAVYTMNAFSANFNLASTRTDESAHSLASAFGRFGYNYKSRYLFNANLRMDGSSRFAKDKKYGYFPSASAAWRLSDEPFMKFATKFLNDAKLRVSYGLTGNESIGNYDAILSYDIGGVYDGGSGLTPARIAVNNLGWEQTSQANLGLDISLFKNRFIITADYYNKVTDNLLASYEIPKEWGFNTVRKNIGSITNKGLELDLRGDVIQTKKFTWNIGLNLSKNDNRIKSIADGIPYIYQSTWWISQGGRIGDFYGYKQLGIFQYDQSNAFTDSWQQLTPVFQTDANGQMIKGTNGKFVLQGYTLDGQTYSGTVKQKTFTNGTPFRGGDVNWEDNPNDVKGRGVISDQDQVILGNAQPKLTGGINTNFMYKNFSLFIASYFSLGGKIYNQAKYTLNTQSMAFFSQMPSPEFANSFWIGQGDLAVYPRPYADQYQNDRSVNSFYLEDGSFLKIRNIRLSYAFEKDMMQRYKIKGLSLYAYVNNAFTFTGYSGYDPEFSTYSALALGQDTNRYPRKREFGIGFNVNF